jgi:hypothetical protein
MVRGAGERKQVPPLRRRIRSGSGRNDKGLGRGQAPAGALTETYLAAGPFRAKFQKRSFWLLLDKGRGHVYPLSFLP